MKNKIGLKSNLEKLKNNKFEKINLSKVWGGAIWCNIIEVYEDESLGKCYNYILTAQDGC